MIVAKVLYRPDSEFARRVEEYSRDFEHSRGRTLELVNLDTRDGADLARRYDIVQYPCIMAIREDGQLLNFWQGIDSFPLMNELDSYLTA